eukprot:1403344-Amphidinium_carterae.1
MIADSLREWRPAPHKACSRNSCWVQGKHAVEAFPTRISGRSAVWCSALSRAVGDKHEYD